MTCLELGPARKTNCHHGNVPKLIEMKDEHIYKWFHRVLCQGWLKNAFYKPFSTKTLFLWGFGAAWTKIAITFTPLIQIRPNQLQTNVITRHYQIQSLDVRSQVCTARVRPKKAENGTKKTGFFLFLQCSPYNKSSPPILGWLQTYIKPFPNV